MALLVAMLGSVEAVEAQSNDGGVDPEGVKNKIGDARMMLEKVEKFVDNKDNSLSNTLNGRAVKTFTFSSGQEVMIAEDKSFTAVSVDDGKQFLYDKDSNGSVDRIVLNKEKKVKMGISF